MKTKILFTVLLSAAFCSCILEDTSDCPPPRNLLFTYYSPFDADESFDNHIAGDVLLCVYGDDRLKSIDLIPYNRIKGEKIYSKRKRFGGDLRIVAWSMPACSANNILQCILGENFYGRFIEMQTAAMVCLPVDDIYLGTETIPGDDVMTESTHTIRMKDVACKVLVTVDDRAGSIGLSAGEPYVLVDGVMSKMDMLYRAAGEEADVYAVLSPTAQEDFYTTGFFGVLPSAQEQSVGIRLLSGNECLAVIRIGERAVAGGKIVINIVPGESVYVEVNGREATPSEVKWM